MIYVIQLDDGRVIDADYPAGTDIAHILSQAKSHYKMNARQYDPTKSPAPISPHVESGAVKREIERGNEALKREIDKADRLREKIGKLESEVVAADRRTLDAKTSRGEALTEAKNAAAKLYACEQTLDQERKARAKAEATSARLREEAAKVQSAPEPRQLIAFRLEEVERDSNGLLKGAVLIPQYAKVTVQ